MDVQPDRRIVVARLIADGEVRVEWVPGEDSITDPSAPTTTELGTGQDVTEELGSLSTPLEGEALPAPDLSSAFQKTVAGTFGGNIEAEMYRNDDGSDAAWNLFERNVTGFFVIRRFGGSDVPITDGDEVEVWPVRCITRSPGDMDAGGSLQTFTTNFAALDEPTMDAVVVDDS